MQTSTPNSKVDKVITLRDVEFPLKELTNGRGFKLLTAQISIAGEKLELAGGLPRKLAKMVRRQPHFGLLSSKAHDDGDIIFQFDKPVDKMSDTCLMQHIFTPMARKIRRSHQAALPTKSSKGRRGLSQPELAPASS